MKSSTKNVAKSVRDVSYYRQRYRNRVFAKLVSFITEQAQRDRVTKKDIAERLNKDRGLISRLLSQPSNLTLDTISDLLLAFDAEAEPPEIVLFADRRPPNYVHPLIRRVLNITPRREILKAESAGSRDTTLPISDPNRPSVRIETTTTAGQ
jgi:transcriptional regulator with XRE-family HTH domain